MSTMIVTKHATNKIKYHLDREDADQALSFQRQPADVRGSSPSWYFRVGFHKKIQLVRPFDLATFLPDSLHHGYNL